MVLNFWPQVEGAMPCSGNCRAFSDVVVRNSAADSNFGTWNWVDRSSGEAKGKSVKIGAGPLEASSSLVQDKLKAKALKVAQSKECAAGCVCEPNPEAREEEIVRPYAKFRVKYNDQYDVTGTAELVYKFKKGTCQDDLEAGD